MKLDNNKKKKRAAFFPPAFLLIVGHVPAGIDTTHGRYVKTQKACPE